MEIGQLLERVVADDIRVEHEERGVVFSEDLLCQFERTSGPKWFGLNGEFNVDSVLFFILQEG